jgi:rhodanese-related sulfurtransferase
MNKKNKLTLVFMCFLSATFLAQFMVSVEANPYTNLNVSEAKEMVDLNPNLVILDVRYLSEYERGHLKNAILIPVGELEERLNELDKDKETLVYCKSGGRSATACAILDAHGFTKVYNMMGGISAWISAGYPIEVVFEVVWEEKNYPVAIFSNSTITSFSFSQPLKQISFDITGPDGTIAFCNVTIPQELLYARSSEWIVMVNDLLIDYTVGMNTTHTWLYFAYSHSTHKVLIIGTRVGSPSPPRPVGGIAAPIDKLMSPTPKMGLALVIVSSLVAAVVSVKLKKKEQ